MLYNALIVLLASSAMAVEDPAGSVKKGKEMHRFLKDLGDLKGDQIEALGSTNAEVCSLMEEVYVEDNEELQDRMRRRLNFSCALAIQKNHANTFGEIFNDAKNGEKMEFVRRMGEQICAEANVFKASCISHQVEKYCTEVKVKQASATAAAAAGTEASNSASHMQASLMTVCVSALMAFLI